MSERIIKWGFIGCGEVTKYKSGPAFQKIENSEVVAVMSRNGDKAKTYAKERGIPKWYDDAQELIDDEEVNAVYIATPVWNVHPSQNPSSFSSIDLFGVEGVLSYFQAGIETVSLFEPSIVLRA